MALGLAFDVYGTLVDPLRMSEHVRDVAGEGADRFAQVWRETQLAYSWKRGLMRRYVPFDRCAREALRYTAQSLQVDIAPEKEQQLLERIQHLAPYADVVPALRVLRAAGHRLFAFSNGTRRMVEELLGNGGVLEHLDGVISVDDVQTFKPDPRTYEHCVRELALPLERCWLISSNPFDCIGAKAAGMHSAWVKRRSLAVFDPWGLDPDVTVSSLEDVPQRLAAAAA